MAEKKKMRCIECKKITDVNAYSWKCDECLNQSPDEKSILETLESAAPIIQENEK